MSSALPSRLLAFLCLCLTGFAIAEDQPASVTLLITVALVDSDLSVKPVPKHRLEITPEGGTSGEALSMTTSFGGEAQSTVAPGTYRIRSIAPVVFKGQSLVWDIPFTVQGPAPLTLELSNDNATITPLTSALPESANASQVFKALKDSVVTLESESGHGTAFLVDARGLLLTNEHVVSGSRFFTAHFDDQHRLPATLVVSDSTEDVAVLLINTSAMPQLPVIALAADTPERPVIQEGEAVYAIGSPLSQERIITAGIASKIETGAIISDVMIDHGNSGGPLLNGRMEAVGINTFGEGRGVSGTIRIWKAFSVMEEARKKLSTMSLPSAEFRPAIPTTKYPADAIKHAVLSEAFDLNDYRIMTRRFEVFFLTPPARCYFEHREEIIAAKGRQQRRKKTTVPDAFDPVADIKGWGQYVGQYDAIVEIAIVPRIKPTFGSSLAAGLLGSNSVMRYRYQGDVDTVRLLKGDKEIQPVRMGRSPIKQLFAGTAGHMEDVAYLGFAHFLPEMFQPAPSSGAAMILSISNEANGETVSVEVDTEMLQRVWGDFAPLRVPAAR